MRGRLEFSAEMVHRRGAEALARATHRSPADHEATAAWIDLLRAERDEARAVLESIAEVGRAHLPAAFGRGDDLRAARDIALASIRETEILARRITEFGAEIDRLHARVDEAVVEERAACAAIAGSIARDAKAALSWGEGDTARAAERYQTADAIDRAIRARSQPSNGGGAK